MPSPQPPSSDDLSNAQFLVLHGFENDRPAAHWQHRLVDRLHEAGREVHYPGFPDPWHPRLDAWLEAFAQTAASIDAGRPLVVIAHSLGTLTWLHAEAAGLTPPSTRRVLLVAPVTPLALRGEANIDAAFSDLADLAGLDARSLPYDLSAVLGEHDPYRSADHESVYLDRLHIPLLLLPEAGHFVIEEGYGRWPALESWALEPGRGIRANAPA